MRERISGGSFLRSRSAAGASRTVYGIRVPRHFPATLHGDACEALPRLWRRRPEHGQWRPADMAGESPNQRARRGCGESSCSLRKKGSPPPDHRARSGRTEAETRVVQVEHLKYGPWRSPQHLPQELFTNTTTPNNRRSIRSPSFSRWTHADQPSASASVPGCHGGVIGYRQGGTMPHVDLAFRVIGAKVPVDHGYAVR